MLSVRHRRHDCSGETYTVYDVLDRGYTDHPMTASANCRRTRTRMHGASSPTAERLSRTSTLILNILCCFICFFCVIDCIFVILFYTQRIYITGNTLLPTGMRARPSPIFLLLRGRLLCTLYTGTGIHPGHQCSKTLMA